VGEDNSGAVREYGKTKKGWAIGKRVWGGTLILLAKISTRGKAGPTNYELCFETDVGLTAAKTPGSEKPCRE